MLDGLLTQRAEDVAGTGAAWAVGRAVAAIVAEPDAGSPINRSLSPHWALSICFRGKVASSGASAHTAEQVPHCMHFFRSPPPEAITSRIKPVSGCTSKTSCTILPQNPLYGIRPDFPEPLHKIVDKAGQLVAFVDGKLRQLQSLRFQPQALERLLDVFHPRSASSLPLMK